MDNTAHLVPGYGAGLSEAEDAMRDSAFSIDLIGPGLKHPTDEPIQRHLPLRLILERTPAGRIYYRVQDRITCINKHQGIKDDVESVINCIPVEDRNQIGEERRYGMGVGK